MKRRSFIAAILGATALAVTSFRRRTANTASSAGWPKIEVRKRRDHYSGCLLILGRRRDFRGAPTRGIAWRVSDDAILNIIEDEGRAVAAERIRQLMAKMKDRLIDMPESVPIKQELDNYAIEEAPGMEVNWIDSFSRNFA